jgi:voltage-gated potassium channel
VPLIVSRFLNQLKRRASWALPIELFLFVFFSSWLLMAHIEPRGSRLTDIDTYWWWFAGTITPAAGGTGEHNPTTAEGRLVGLYVIVGGIVTITVLFTRLAQMIHNARGLRMTGQQSVALSRHIVVLGYTAGRTEQIIDSLVAEEPCEIVICAWETQVTEHPMAHRESVHFVRGSLTDDDVLRRAALPDATAVLVDARDADEALKVTVAVHYLSPDVHTVVALDDMAHARTVAMVAPNAWCVQWHLPELIADELQDAGMSQVYHDMVALNERNTYSIAVPDTLPNRTFGEFQQALGRWNAATILAVRSDSGLRLSPSWRHEIPVGATLYYVARQRLRTQDLERLVDRSERALVFTEQEMLRAEWH